MAKTNVICIGPVKNESWIIEHYIESARSWADLIIIGDNGSTDNTVRLAQQFDFVKVINVGSAINEHNSRYMLINEARKVPGRRLIFALDADEMISANWASSSEWNLMLTAPPGTRFVFDWTELFPGLEQAALYSMPAAFVDDNTEFRGMPVHSPRLPFSDGEVVKLKDIKLLHYLWIDPEHALSKARWKKCRDYIKKFDRPWNICIRYQDGEMKTYDQPIVDVDEAWISGYKWLNAYRAGSKQSNLDKTFWYDIEVLNAFDEYGTDRFRKINIWDIDWNKKALLLGKKDNYTDPRSKLEMLLHKFIRKYREDLKLQKSFFFLLTYRLGRKALGPFGW
ncbi:MAG: glycosyltransferase family 2 protein [Syntrophobacteraceae bacterium]